METVYTDESVPRTGIALPSQVASYLGTSTNRLARLRSEGQSPVWLKIGKSVRYRWEDIHRFVEENLRATTEVDRRTSEGFDLHGDGEEVK